MTWMVENLQDSSECDSFKIKNKPQWQSLFNSTILKTNTKIKHSIKYTFKHYKTISRVTCFFSSITQVCLFLWTKAPQVCSSYHRGSRLENVDCCSANIVKTIKKNICMKTNTSKSLHRHDNNSSTFLLWVVTFVCIYKHSLTDLLPHKDSYSLNLVGLNKMP